ncbi:MAG: protein-L-isoaspartate(D-aspartate) O-methyltransferase [Bacteroidales bacterium]
MGFNDSFEARGKRKKLVDEIRSKGITDERVLEAVNKVPRHYFMDPAFLNHAYQDKAFPISSGQTISQPYTVAFQTQLLRVEKKSKILEIGTGSGYQAAILVEMGARVFTIERHRELYQKARKMMAALGYEASYFFGDGYLGKLSYSPYDGILLTAATDQIPETLLRQLAIGGRLVAPVGNRNSQEMTLVIRKGEDEFEYSNHGYFAFVPMLPGVVNDKK